LNIIERLWSVLETTVRNRFPPPSFLKQLEDVLQQEWYKIPLKTVQNLFESIPRRIAAVLKANVVQHHINKEMCTVSVLYLLLCPTPGFLRIWFFHVDSTESLCLMFSSVLTLW
jgi:hypothetical protein